MSAPSLRRYLNRCRREILERCTLCGSCVANCEINRFTALKGIDPVHVADRVREYIASGTYEQVVYDFAFQCINCLECTTYCPEALPASTIPILAKERLTREGHDAPALFTMTRPCQEYSLQNILCALQTAPSERWWIDNVPDKPDAHDVVLFMGCNEMPFPSAMAAARDILTELGIDFVAVGGGTKLCCGAVHLHTGEPETAGGMVSALVESLGRFRPRTVVFTCPTCAYVVRKSFEDERTGSTRYVHFSQFLAERLDSISLKKSLEGSFTVQDPCFTARGLGDYDSPRRVLSAIAGIELVEMEHSRENALCCGVTALANNPPDVADAFIRNRLSEATAADADTIVNLCAGCQMAFFGYEKDFGLSVRMFSEIVGEAMGLPLSPDKMKLYRDLADPSRIIEAARYEIEASVYDEDTVMSVLPFLFRG